MKTFPNVHNYLVRVIGHFVLYPNINKDIQEEFNMKTAVCQTIRSRQHALPFPNAADRRYFLHKLLDALLMVAIGVGIGTCLLFLLTIS